MTARPSPSLACYVFALVGCTGGTSATSSGDPEPAHSAADEGPVARPAGTPNPGYVGEDSQIDRAILEFADARKKAEFDQLWSCFQRDGQPGWFAYPLRRYGNFVNVEWCRGHGAQINCSGGDTRSKPPAAWSELEVLHFDRDWPAVFGLSFSVGDLPADGLGVSVSWSESGQGVLGDHASVVFTEVARGQVVTDLVVAASLAFELGLEGIEVRGEITGAALMAKLRSDPSAPAEEARARLDALETAVLAALDADTPRKCIYGEYENDGVPPPCLEQVPLDAEEKQAARHRLSEYLGARRGLIRKHADKLHPRMMEVLPLECWTPSVGGEPPP